MKDRMLKHGLALGVIVFAAAGRLAAQGAAAPAGDLAEKILGIWEGPYQSDAAPPGSIRLVVAKENGAWKVSLGVISDQDIPASDVADFKVEGSQVSWSQGIAGMDCRTVATIENGFLKGGTECGNGGGMAITATFLLARK